MRDVILDSTITITDKSSLGVAGLKTTEIIRKVFLLSYTELGLKDLSVVAIEGKPLKYFKSVSSRIAKYGDELGARGGWWLRSPLTWEDTCAMYIGFNTSYSATSVFYESGVRPAFCVDNDTPITLRSDVVIGQDVYVLGN